MKVYRCHKQVHAMKIGRVVGKTLFSEDGKEAVDVSNEFLRRWALSLVGGYYVLYRDGYASFSPAKEFEDGYAEISSPVFQD
jgi:hypothetical protein